MDSVLTSSQLRSEPVGADATSAAASPAVVATEAVALSAQCDRGDAAAQTSSIVNASVEGRVADTEGRQDDDADVDEFEHTRFSRLSSESFANTFVLSGVSSPGLRSQPGPTAAAAPTPERHVAPLPTLKELEALRGPHCVVNSSAQGQGPTVPTLPAPDVSSLAGPPPPGHHRDPSIATNAAASCASGLSSFALTSPPVLPLSFLGDSNDALLPIPAPSGLTADTNERTVAATSQQQQPGESVVAESGAAAPSLSSVPRDGVQNRVVSAGRHADGARYLSSLPVARRSITALSASGDADFSLGVEGSNAPRTPLIGRSHPAQPPRHRALSAVGTVTVSDASSTDATLSPPPSLAGRDSVSAATSRGLGRGNFVEPAREGQHRREGLDDDGSDAVFGSEPPSETRMMLTPHVGFTTSPSGLSRPSAASALASPLMMSTAMTLSSKSRGTTAPNSAQHGPVRPSVGSRSGHYTVMSHGGGGHSQSLSHSGGSSKTKGGSTSDSATTPPMAGVSRHGRDDEEREEDSLTLQRTMSARSSLPPAAQSHVTPPHYSQLPTPMVGAATPGNAHLLCSPLMSSCASTSVLLHSPEGPAEMQGDSFSMAPPAALVRKGESSSETLDENDCAEGAALLQSLHVRSNSHGRGTGARSYAPWALPKSSSREELRPQSTTFRAGSSHADRRPRSEPDHGMLGTTPDATQISSISGRTVSSARVELPAPSPLVLAQHGSRTDVSSVSATPGMKKSSTRGSMSDLTLSVANSNAPSGAVTENCTPCPTSASSPTKPDALHSGRGYTIIGKVSGGAAAPASGSVTRRRHSFSSFFEADVPEQESDHRGVRSSHSTSTASRRGSEPPMHDALGFGSPATTDVAPFPDRQSTHGNVNVDGSSTIIPHLSTVARRGPSERRDSVGFSDSYNTAAPPVDEPTAPLAVDVGAVEEQHHGSDLHAPSEDSGLVQRFSPARGGASLNASPLTSGVDRGHSAFGVTSATVSVAGARAASLYDISQATSVAASPQCRSVGPSSLFSRPVHSISQHPRRPSRDVHAAQNDDTEEGSSNPSPMPSQPLPSPELRSTSTMEVQALPNLDSTASVQGVSIPISTLSAVPLLSSVELPPALRAATAAEAEGNDDMGRQDERQQERSTTSSGAIHDLTKPTSRPDGDHSSSSLLVSPMTLASPSQAHNVLTGGPVSAPASAAPSPGHLKVSPSTNNTSGSSAVVGMRMSRRPTAADFPSEKEPTPVSSASKAITEINQQQQQQRLIDNDRTAAASAPPQQSATTPQLVVVPDGVRRSSEAPTVVTTTSDGSGGTGVSSDTMNAGQSTLEIDSRLLSKHRQRSGLFPAIPSNSSNFALASESLTEDPTVLEHEHLMPRVLSDSPQPPSSAVDRSHNKEGSDRDRSATTVRTTVLSPATQTESPFPVNPSVSPSVQTQQTLSQTLSPSVKAEVDVHPRRGEMLLTVPPRSPTTTTPVASSDLPFPPAQPQEAMAATPDESASAAVDVRRDRSGSRTGVAVVISPASPPPLETFSPTDTGVEPPQGGASASTCALSPKTAHRFSESGTASPTAAALLVSMLSNASFPRPGGDAAEDGGDGGSGSSDSRQRVSKEELGLELSTRSAGLLSLVSPAARPQSVMSLFSPQGSTGTMPPRTPTHKSSAPKLARTSSDVVRQSTDDIASTVGSITISPIKPAGPTPVEGLSMNIKVDGKTAAPTAPTAAVKEMGGSTLTEGVSSPTGDYAHASTKSYGTATATGTHEGRPPSALAHSAAPTTPLDHAHGASLMTASPDGQPSLVDESPMTTTTGASGSATFSSRNGSDPPTVDRTAVDASPKSAVAAAHATVPPVGLSTPLRSPAVGSTTPLVRLEAADSVPGTPGASPTGQLNGAGAAAGVPGFPRAMSQRSIPRATSSGIGLTADFDIARIGSDIGSGAPTANPSRNPSFFAPIGPPLLSPRDVASAGSSTTMSLRTPVRNESIVAAPRGSRDLTSPLELHLERRGGLPPPALAMECRSSESRVSGDRPLSSDTNNAHVEITSDLSSPCPEDVHSNNGLHLGSPGSQVLFSENSSMAGPGAPPLLSEDDRGLASILGVTLPAATTTQSPGITRSSGMGMGGDVAFSSRGALRGDGPLAAAPGQGQGQARPSPTMAPTGAPLVTTTSGVKLPQRAGIGRRRSVSMTTTVYPRAAPVQSPPPMQEGTLSRAESFKSQRSVRSARVAVAAPPSTDDLFPLDDDDDDGAHSSHSAAVGATAQGSTINGGSSVGSHYSLTQYGAPQFSSRPSVGKTDAAAANTNGPGLSRCSSMGPAPAAHVGQQGYHHQQQQPPVGNLPQYNQAYQSKMSRRASVSSLRAVADAYARGGEESPTYDDRSAGPSSTRPSPGADQEAMCRQGSNPLAFVTTPPPALVPLVQTGELPQPFGRDGAGMLPPAYYDTRTDARGLVAGAGGGESTNTMTNTRSGEILTPMAVPSTAMPPVPMFALPTGLASGAASERRLSADPLPVGGHSGSQPETHGTVKDGATVRSDSMCARSDDDAAFLLPPAAKEKPPGLPLGIGKDGFVLSSVHAAKDDARVVVHGENSSTASPIPPTQATAGSRTPTPGLRSSFAVSGPAALQPLMMANNESFVSVASMQPAPADPSTSGRSNNVGGVDEDDALTSKYNNMPPMATDLRSPATAELAVIALSGKELTDLAGPSLSDAAVNGKEGQSAHHGLMPSPALVDVIPARHVVDTADHRAVDITSGAVEAELRKELNDSNSHWRGSTGSRVGAASTDKSGTTHSPHISRTVSGLPVSGASYGSSATATSTSGIVDDGGAGPISSSGGAAADVMPSAPAVPKKDDRVQRSPTVAGEVTMHLLSSRERFLETGGGAGPYIMPPSAFAQQAAQQTTPQQQQPRFVPAHNAQRPNAGLRSSPTPVGLSVSSSMASLHAANGGDSDQSVTPVHSAGFESCDGQNRDRDPATSTGQEAPVAILLDGKEITTTAAGPKPAAARHPGLPLPPVPSPHGSDLPRPGHSARQSNSGSAAGSAAPVGLSPFALRTNASSQPSSNPRTPHFDASSAAAASPTTLPSASALGTPMGQPADDVRRAPSPLGRHDGRLSPHRSVSKLSLFDRSISPAPLLADPPTGAPPALFDETVPSHTTYLSDGRGLAGGGGGGGAWNRSTSAVSSVYSAPFSAGVSQQILPAAGQSLHGQSLHGKSLHGQSLQGQSSMVHSFVASTTASAQQSPGSFAGGARQSQTPGTRSPATSQRSKQLQPMVFPDGPLIAVQCPAEGSHGGVPSLPAFDLSSDLVDLPAPFGITDSAPGFAPLPPPGDSITHSISHDMGSGNQSGTLIGELSEEVDVKRLAELGVPPRTPVVPATAKETSTMSPAPQPRPVDQSYSGFLLDSQTSPRRSVHADSEGAPHAQKPALKSPPFGLQGPGYGVSLGQGAVGLASGRTSPSRPSGKASPVPLFDDPVVMQAARDVRLTSGRTSPAMGRSSTTTVTTATTTCDPTSVTTAAGAAGARPQRLAPIRIASDELFQLEDDDDE